MYVLGYILTCWYYIRLRITTRLRHRRGSRGIVKYAHSRGAGWSFVCFFFLSFGRIFFFNYFHLYDRHNASAVVIYPLVSSATRPFFPHNALRCRDRYIILSLRTHRTPCNVYAHSRPNNILVRMNIYAYIHTHTRARAHTHQCKDS